MLKKIFNKEKTCPKCNKEFNMNDVSMRRVTKCPNCNTPLIATLYSTFVTGIYMVVIYGISQILDMYGIVTFYIPFILLAAIGLFLIEPLSMKYKIKD
ncbi:hypothetical protein M4I33_08520 [Clostridium sp. LY3-2]|uniref:hypothetical protein n=1 Tax=Clostridium sp. LY3-2 TaxID=2942482 RepID=UPI0021531DD0|nr:hypothetical protein [Clostridium sp. LY3-2]MCR6514918.1 hypothetical protein [Clostridium sp. LY3-2]